MESLFEALIVSNLPIIFLFKGLHAIECVYKHLSRLEQGILKDFVVDIRRDPRLLRLRNLWVAPVRLL